MATPTASQLVEKLMKAAFDRPRDPRSFAYKLGVRSLLTSRATKTPLVRPYAAGTVEFDAFFSGVDEGHAVWRQHEVPA